MSSVHNPSIQKTFESAASQVVSGGSYTFAHGLGQRPSNVNLLFRCKTSAGGYSVGDEIWAGRADGNNAHSIMADETNVYIRLFTGGSTALVRQRSSNSTFGLVLASWEVKVIAS